MTDTNERIPVGEHVTIYPRGVKRTWVADFWRDGRHCRISLRTSNKKIATQRALKLEVELAEGSYRAPPPPTPIREAVDDYLLFLETEHQARKTLVKYRGSLNLLIRFLAEQHVTRLSQFTLTHFERFRAVRKKEGLHAKTMYTEGTIIKQLFKWARSRKKITENPIAEYGLDKPQLPPRGGPDLEQVNRILAALKEPKLTQIALLAFTGMRAGELQRLKPEDVDLKGNWIAIESRPGLETKTRLSRRIPIHARLRPLLVKLPKGQRPWLFTAGASTRYPDGDHHINIKRLNEDFLKVLTRLGLPAGRDGNGFTLHSLRHFFETFAVNSGIPQRVIDSWLGHSSDQSMAARYYKLSDKDSQAFMKKVPFGTGKPAADAGVKE
jgi:integrase